jgi:small subunit ribosomal protein S16
MAVVIRLMRTGAKKRPYYRLVAADSRRQRDGRFLEILGHYNPIEQPHKLVVEKERVEQWIANGAQPSEQVASLLRTIGVTTSKPSKPKKKKKAKTEAKAAGGAKPKRAVKKVVSARKTEKKAKKSATKKAAKKAAK